MRVHKMTNVLTFFVILFCNVSNGFTAVRSLYRKPFLNGSFQRERRLYYKHRRRTCSNLFMSASSLESDNKESLKPTQYENRKSRTNKKYKGKRNSRIKEKDEIRKMFKKAKNLERSGQWKEAVRLLEKILDGHPQDSHSHLALARLEARRERTHRYYTSIKRHNNDNSTQVFSRARAAFQRGMQECPNNVHLLQAYALYEQSCNNMDHARELFEKALRVDKFNPYVNHAYGLMEQNLGNAAHARKLWKSALERRPTAALVCSLGEQLIASKQQSEARDLYNRFAAQLNSEREKTEVYLAAAWLEEKHFSNLDRAEELINLALLESPGSSRAHVALARLEQRMEGGKDGSGKAAAVRHLANACISIENGKAASPKDGRLFNAWANLEVKSGRLEVARKILLQGMQRHPDDQSLFQAAGKVEERVGNFTGARDLYSASLLVEPCAPALVAIAMLELRHPETKPANYTKVERLFEEALLLDPRHGPAYNAYGNMELRRGNIEKAREIHERGLHAHCTDAASVYHGLAKLELSVGEVDRAREVLVKGLREAEIKDTGMDSAQRGRAVFLAHTLGMLELNSNRATDAMAVFQDGIARHGNSSQLLLGAALCEVKLGKEDSARLLFERAVNADKKHAQAWQAWGVMELRAGNIRTARQLFDSGIRSTPRHSALWNAYATMEGRMGNKETARALFAAGLKKCRSNLAPLLQGWASLEMQTGNYVTAKKLISEALTRDKTLGSGWLIAAHIEELQGNDGLVGLLLRRGIECSPNDAQLYCALGEYLVKTGKYQDAREIYEKGLEVNPLHAPLYHSLAELEARLFNLEGLSELNKRAAALFNSDATSPSPSFSSAWGKRIQNRKWRKVPDGVAALSQQIGESVDANDNSLRDPSSLDSMGLEEDEMVQDLLKADDVIPSDSRQES